MPVIKPEEKPPWKQALNYYAQSGLQGSAFLNKRYNSIIVITYELMPLRWR